MSFSLDFGIWNSVFAVPYELMNKHIKLCSQNELKFILWVFAHPNAKIIKEQICEEAGVPPIAFEDCLAYWKQSGLFADKPANTVEIQVPKPVEPVQVRTKMLRPDSIYIASRINEDKQIEFLFSQAQMILGRTLSPTISAILIVAYDDYLLPIEVLLMLLNFCVSISQTSTSYIERLVINWYENGINTLALAEEKIIELSEKNTAWKKFSQIIGLTPRKPIKTEEELALLVVNKFSEDMINLAYQKCVENTGRFQAKYMLKIFNDWLAKGFTAVVDVEIYESRNRSENDSSRTTSFDMDDFSKLNVFNLGDE